MVKWGKTKAYEIQAGCYNVGWLKGLYFFPDRTDSSSGVKVNCDDWKLTYNSKGEFHRAVFPRKCIPKANDSVRVQAESATFSSDELGKAGPRNCSVGASQAGAVPATPNALLEAQRGGRESQ